MISLAVSGINHTEPPRAQSPRLGGLTVRGTTFGSGNSHNVDAVW